MVLGSISRESKTLKEQLLKGGRVLEKRAEQQKKQIQKHNRSWHQTPQEKINHKGENRFLRQEGGKEPG